MKPSAVERFAELLTIMERLRAPGGCPWDREQTFASLRPYILEETYEILESIDEERFADLKEELGDSLLHIVFLSQIAQEQGLFDAADVIEAINTKLVRRHPHVFGDVKVESVGQVLKNWESIKLGEGDHSAAGFPKTVLGGVPKSVPALLRAYRVQEKAAGVGFDWEKVEQVLDKVREEIEELKTARAEGQQAQVEDELGDLLFSIVNLARFWKISPEEALRGTTEKFIRRFNYIEEQLKVQGKDIHKSTLEEMDRLWDEAKRRGR
jgi:tetrapyrrole methylase family protein/MazG family protein